MTREAKLVTYALYIECTVDASLSDAEAAKVVYDMYMSGDASASDNDPHLIGVKTVTLDEDGFPIH